MISIIIPLYNRLLSGFKLINKLYDQIGNRDVQVICVNDGSTEELVFEAPIEAVCKAYGFEYYKQKNGGEASARNTGLEKVKGEYFTYIDCDDSITDNYVDNLFSELGNGEDMVAFRWKFLSSGELCNWHEKPLVNWNVWSYVFKTDYFKNFKFDESMIVASDYEWLERATKAKPDLTVRYAPEKVTIIYNADNPESLTNKFGRGEVKARKEEA